MILISAEEKEAVRKRLPRVFIYRTVKQKSKRHHYYMEEHPKAMKIIEALRRG